MKVFITGHTGFIGSNLSSFVESFGHEVVGCSRKTGCDLGDIEVLKSKLSACEIVFHLAADARPAESLLAPWETIEANIRTTINIALVCRDRNVPIIYASSCEIYGDSHSVIVEETPFMPTNPYAASKAACDRTLYSFHKCYGLDVKIVRLFNPYGPGQQLNKVIPTFYRQAKANRPLTVYGDGTDTRDYVFVEDIVRGLWDARKLPHGETINLATQIKTRTDDLAKMIIRRTRSRSKIQFISYPKLFGGIKYQVGSYEKAKKILGWEPRISLDNGLEKTIKWLESLESS